jgi:hypothetical protein
MEAFDVLEGWSRHDTKTVMILANIDTNVNYNDYRDCLIQHGANFGTVFVGHESQHAGVRGGQSES